jgi:hypothetical protein
MRPDRQPHLNHLAPIQVIHWHHPLVQDTKHHQLLRMNHVINDMTDVGEAQHVLPYIRPGLSQGRGFSQQVKGLSEFEQVFLRLRFSPSV